MSEKWVLGGGRNIETPDGTFYLSYGTDKNGKPHFKDFVKLDAIARQVAALPELIEALKECESWMAEAYIDSVVDRGYKETPKILETVGAILKKIQ
jgi:hypothetical protein